MKFLQQVCQTCVLTVGLGAIALSIQAARLSDGRVYFEEQPRLESATTTEQVTSASTATYYFTITLPAGAGEPLQQIQIAQRNGSNFVRRVEYELDESFAFVGTRRDRGEDLSILESTYYEDSQTLSVIFDPPVPPGTTVTLGLRPERNPHQEGVYLFGVTAFPAGEAPYGQFLGYGRFNFYRGSDFILNLWR
jgi:hypothetical protein